MRASALFGEPGNLHENQKYAFYLASKLLARRCLACRAQSETKITYVMCARSQGENPCHVLLVLLGLMSAPHCTHVRAALVSIKESS